jgi:hypothetical protein
VKYLETYKILIINALSIFCHFDQGKNNKKNVLTDFAKINPFFDRKHLYMNIGLIDIGIKNKKHTKKNQKNCME